LFINYYLETELFGVEFEEDDQHRIEHDQKGYRRYQKAIENQQELCGLVLQ